MSNETQPEKKYRETIGAFYKKDTGNFVSIKVDQKTLDQMSKVKLGDKLLLVVRSNTVDENSPKPNAYLEIFTGGKE